MFISIGVNSCMFKTYSHHLTKYLIAQRYVRSLAKRFPDRVRSLKGKVVSEPPSENQTEFELNNITSVNDLRRTVKKLFGNVEEMDVEAEFFGKDHANVIQNADVFYDMNLAEQRQRRIAIGKQITIRKYFKTPPETNLLTFAAKSQICYLHEKNPYEWTPERLAECFPVTIDGVKKILKFPYAVSDNFIKNHDDEVEKNWELLESGKGKKLSSVTYRLYKEGKFTKENYAGNFNFPMAPLRKKEPRRKFGEFMSIIKPYLDSKEKNKEKSLEVHNNDENGLVINSASNYPTVREGLPSNITKGILPKLKYRYPSERELEDTESASFLAAENHDENETDLLCSQFEENLHKEYSEKKKKNPVDISYENWLKNQTSEIKQNVNNLPISVDSKDTCSTKKEFKIVKKYNADLKNEGEGNSHINKQSAYSQQIPAKDPIRRKIKVPEHLKKVGTLYRVDNCFYDENGHFLYKLCL